MVKNPSIIQPLQTGRGQMPGPRLLAANAKSRGNSLFSNPEVTPWPRKQFLPPTGSRCRILEYVRTNIIRFAIRNSFGKTKCRKRHLVFFSNIIVVFHQMVKFHWLVKFLINGNLFMESCKSNLQTMEYYKISENLKYACLRSKIQSIKTHPYAVNLHKLIKTLSTPDSDINLAFLVALGLESKSEKMSYNSKFSSAWYFKSFLIFPVVKFKTYSMKQS